MPQIDGNYVQHLSNGGCGSIHHNGKWFCQGMEGHYNYPTGEWHYARVMESRGGVPFQSYAVRWA